MQQVENTKRIYLSQPGITLHEAVSAYLKNEEVIDQKRLGGFSYAVQEGTIGTWKHFREKLSLSDQELAEVFKQTGYSSDMPIPLLDDLSPEGLVQAQRLQQYLVANGHDISNILGSKSSQQTVDAIIGLYLVGGKFVLQGTGAFINGPSGLNVERTRELYLKNVVKDRSLIMANRNVTSALVGHLGHEGEYSPGHGSLTTLDIREGKIINLEYIANSEM